jgi:PhzF family phenazine biosynthesis protein
MKRTLYQVDAFASEVFKGNPAAVCICDQWPDPKLMQKVANENNLSETAFAVPRGGCYEIRWFTPEMEVELCGHATLATAHVLFQYKGHKGDLICFDTVHSGRLQVIRNGDLLTLDFPADTLEAMVVPELIVTALQTPPLKAFRGKTDFLFVFASQSEIENMKPDFGLLAQVGGRGVIVTALGNEVDFVSRFFAPQTGINEDPVTGSAHTALTPYWSRVLGKKELTARQLSARGGDLYCVDRGDRVHISGHAHTYMIGEVDF